MAIYRTSVTGVVIDTPCKVSGPNWSRVTKAQLKAESEQNQEPDQNEETEQESTGE